jgi:hypothetical protein
VRLLRTAADAVASRAEQADLQLELALSDAELVVRADPDRLRAAIENPLDNALKFTPPGGSVQLGARAENGRALIWAKGRRPRHPARRQRPRLRALLPGAQHGGPPGQRPGSGHRARRGGGLRR